ncbi:MAG: hexose kinase [Acidobacteria bacterium]|nr:hexose kinase [Acidobacteriota bacterium]
MIVIVNLNPAVDRLLTFSKIQPGMVHRSRSVQLVAGGKGINVARVLSRLQTPAEVCLFLGGDTGRLLQRLLTQEGIVPCVIETTVETRCCSIGYDESTGEDTVWNEPGESPTADQWLTYRQRFGERIKPGSLVLLSGSAPPQSPESIFQALTRQAQTADCRVLVDISPADLLKVLPANPWLVKPNHHEAGNALGQSVATVLDAIQAGRELCLRGAQNALITLGAQGAVLLTNAGEIWHLTVPDLSTFGRLFHTGAGDATLAGIACGLQQKQLPLLEAVQFGLASGTTFTRYGRTLDPAEVERMVNEIGLKKTGLGSVKK